MTKADISKKPALVPMGVTIGLGVFAFILSIAGYLLRLMIEKDKSAVLLHALKVVPVFMLVVPILMCAGAHLLNHLGKANIRMRNAWTLGWLLSCVAMLSIMGVYS